MVPDAIEMLAGHSGTLLRSILVVEDEEGIRMCLAEYLRDYGYEVIEAGGAAEAKDVLCRRPVDLVFSDINMGRGETGFTLEKWIRGCHPETKVLLTSGFPQALSDTRGLREPLIQKPYSYAGLRRRIETVLHEG